jgi:DNA-binding NarL/FixJ family response regulator
MTETKRILIIDDVELWHEMITELLRIRKINNIEIYHEETPDGGVRKYEDLLLSNKRPDLVLLDYRFGGVLNGVNAAKYIMELDNEANIYVFTFYPTPEVIKEMAEVGVSNFLSKLDNSNVLIGEIVEVCEAMSKEIPTIILNA